MNIPELPKYEKDIKKLEKVYKSAFLKIVKQLEKVDPKDLLRQELYESQLRQITYIVSQLTEDSVTWFEEHLTKGFKDSYHASLVTAGLADSLLEAKGKAEFSLMARERIEALVGDSFQDVLKAHSVMENKLKETVRKAQAEVLREQYIMQRVSTTGAKALKSRLLEEGFSRSLLEEDWKGITDAGGKRWDLTTYTKMVAKTKFQQAQIEGAKQVALENESDLALISSHGASDACRFFEGLIVSLDGRTRGYKTLAEVRASGLIFHPNCQHVVHTIGDIDALPKSIRDKAQKADTQSQKAMDNRDKILQEDNQRRYRDKKERQEMIRQARRNSLAKAREAKKIGQTKSSMVNEPTGVLVPEKTKLGKQFKKELYEGTPLLEVADDRRNPKAVKELFGDKMTLEGIGKAYNPDPSKYNVDFRFLKAQDVGNGMYLAEVDLNILDKNKNHIGRINRTILKKPDGSMVVQNTYFELEKEYQGAGFARDVYFKTEQLYKEMAKGKPIDITLTANLDVGVYAWSRHGFDFKDPDDAWNLRRTLESDINKEIVRKYKAGEVSKEDWFKNRSKLFQDELKRFGYNSIDEITHAWQFGALDNGTKHDIYTTGGQGHYGKKLLLNMGTWKGVKKLNQGHDSEIMGNLYFQSKGVK